MTLLEKKVQLRIRCMRLMAIGLCVLPIACSDSSYMRKEWWERGENYCAQFGGLVSMSSVSEARNHYWITAHCKSPPIRIQWAEKYEEK